MDEEKYSYQDIAFYCKEICDQLNAKLDDGNPVYFPQIYSSLVQSRNFLLTPQNLDILDCLLKIPKIEDPLIKDMIVDKIYQVPQYPLPLLFLLVRVHIVGEVCRCLFSKEDTNRHHFFLEDEVVPFVCSCINKNWDKTIKYWIKNCCNGSFTKDKINLSCIKYSK